MELMKSSFPIELTTTPFTETSALHEFLSESSYSQSPASLAVTAESLGNAKNASSVPFHDEILTRIEVLVLIILFISTLVGNISVIIILLFFNNKSKKSCFSYNNVSRMSFYIINLSLADISVAMLSIFPQIIWRYSVLFWASSQFVCKSVTYGQVSLIKLIKL